MGTEQVKSRPVPVSSLGLSDVEGEVREIAKGGATSELDQNEFRKAAEILEKMRARVLAKGYEAIEIPGPAITNRDSNTVVVRETRGVAQYRLEDGKIYRRDLLLEGAETLIYQGWPDRNMGEVLRIATNGRQVYFLIQNRNDTGRQVLTHVHCSLHGRMTLASVWQKDSAQLIDENQNLRDLVIEGGEIKVEYRSLQGSSRQTVSVAYGSGYFFD